MSKIIVMRNTAQDPPYVLKNRMGRPLKLSQSSKIGVTNINILRPQNYEFVTDSDLIALGYLNNGNNSAFQIVQQIPDGKYSYDTFARVVQNCLNNMLITTGGDFDALTRPANLSYDFGDGNYILARYYDNTQNTSCVVVYNSDTKKYTITFDTSPTPYLSANGSDCTSLVNIDFAPDEAGVFNVLQPAGPGVQNGAFKLATGQSIGSFIFGHPITLENPGLPAHHNRVSLVFVNTVTGHIDLQLDAFIEYRAAMNVYANLVVNNGVNVTNKQINLLQIGTLRDLRVIFHRLAGKCGITFYGQNHLDPAFVTLGTHAMDLEAKFWDNTIYDINYSCEIAFKNTAAPFAQRAVFHSPISGSQSSQSSQSQSSQSSQSSTFYVNDPPKPIEDPRISIIRETVRCINLTYFNEVMKIEEENELNGFIDVPTYQTEVAPDENVEVLPSKTLEFYFNPMDCNQRLGFLYKSYTPTGALAYYFNSVNPPVSKSLMSDFSAILDSSEENQCVILIRGVPVSGLCSDDYGSGNSFNVLDSLSLVWNENDGYIANFRPPIMQSVQNREVMTLTELELNLVGPDGITPLEMAAGAVVSLYITGVIE